MREDYLVMSTVAKMLMIASTVAVGAMCQDTRSRVVERKLNLDQVTMAINGASQEIAAKSGMAMTLPGLMSTLCTELHVSRSEYHGVELGHVFGWSILGYEESYTNSRTWFPKLTPDAISSGPIVSTSGVFNTPERSALSK